MGATRRRFVQASALAVPALALARPFALAAERPVKKMRILILGGTGFTGPHQVAYALARGHTVTLFNRGKEPNLWPGRARSRS